MRLPLAAAIALSLTFPLSAATIDVQVTEANGAAAREAVVYAIPATPIAVGHKVASMDQKDRMFVPHVLPIQTGTWVEFPNSDNIRHQVYSLSPVKKFQLPLYTGKPAYPVQFNKPGVVAIGCNIHEQMGAYIVVVDTPYFARAEGTHVSLNDLGAGQYTVHVWYPEMREEPKPQTVTLAATDHPTLSFVKKAKG